MTDSIGWYEDNAEGFFERSVDAAILTEQRAFADLLPPGGRVLDAGCGSGRDARLFREWGFQVTATEAAPKLAALARAHAGVEVEVTTFDRMDWTEAFDGIWTCASLLHVPRAELPAVLTRLRRALKPGGAWFISFKYGVRDREVGGRHFTDMDEAGARRLLAEVGGLDLLSMWTSGDVRPGRGKERWLGLFCRRVDQVDM
ncbi:class I SAM-dependent methyltransferase [Phenylobacterium sp.]|uniref:class I SAM-dependent methyltransferase n=1 Tax=Phenylobacterium sp. TaxID=1871053 RepID=UPI0025F897A4|nr:class I SAM-dependent methyltransferase [Phenylobacterium sp.]